MSKKEYYTLEQLRKMNQLDGSKKLIFVEQHQKVLENQLIAFGKISVTEKAIRLLLDCELAKQREEFKEIIDKILCCSTLDLNYGHQCIDIDCINCVKNRELKEELSHKCTKQRGLR